MLQEKKSVQSVDLISSLTMPKLCNTKMLFVLRIIVLKTTIQYEKLIWNAIYSTGHPNLDKPYHFILKRLHFHTKFLLEKSLHPCYTGIHSEVNEAASLASLH